MHISKNKSLLIFIPLLLVLAWCSNSCKKNDPNASIKLFLVGRWRLAALNVDNFRGDSLKRDTLNTNCGFQQRFQFNDDGTCNYYYYSCLDHIAAGNWSLSDDRLVLRSDIICQDTSALKSSQPFKEARIINLGQNSLVLEVSETLDTLRRVPLSLKRRVTRYGFIH